MEYLSAENPVWANAEHTAITLSVDFVGVGRVPFGCMGAEDGAHGMEIYARAIAGDFGPIAPYVEPVPTPEQVLAEKKRQRQAIVDAITVTTSTGKVFDGNEDAQSRMSRAIQTAQIANIPSTTWVLANNVPTTVTLAELQEALVLSMQAMSAVWATPYEE